MAPEMTMTAEALLAGLAERENADEKDDAELKLLGARWRPGLWLDTVKKPLQTPTRSAVGFGWEIAPGPHVSRSTNVVHHREGFTPRNVSRRPTNGSPAPAKRMLKISSAVTGLGEPHQELQPVGWSPATVHIEGTNVINWTWGVQAPRGVRGRRPHTEPIEPVIGRRVVLCRPSAVPIAERRAGRPHRGAGL